MPISKEFLSGSTNGRGVLVAASATPGTLVHTAHATSKDEVHIYCSNDDTTVEVLVQVEFGGVTNPNDVIQFKVPPLETVLGVPGIPVSGGLLVRVHASVASKISCFGFVNRIS